MTVASNLMQGKRGLIMGVANDHSIAYGIARVLARHGATLAFTYQGEAVAKRVKPLAQGLGSSLVLPCDVEDVATVDEVFARLEYDWGEMDFFVHSIAYSDKSELKGLYANTSRENFIRTLVISCFSFTEAARRAASLMKKGGSLLTVSFGGGTHVMPNYNVMGVAKAALDSSVRYLAADFGDRGIRVNALSPGPVRTMAGAGITGARAMGSFQKKHCPLRRMITLDEIGGSALYLLSELSGGVTGEVHLVDAGYNIMLQPRPEDLNGEE
ncbi:enoyl-ACP reductase FabI [Methylocystis sp.]|uniref:enoyl-ACP reductase FabI n=1 Tax=Methylocystis sp. TaxID=1911079 RepID=UPI003D122FA7